MKYYRVRPEYDQRPRYVWKYFQGVPDGVVLAGELYTPKEYERLAMCPAWFEEVNVSKRNIYWSFGARFQMGE